MVAINKDGIDFLATLESASHKAQMITARAPSSFSDSPFWLFIQRYNSVAVSGFSTTTPHKQPRVWNIAVPALVLVLVKFLALGICTTEGKK